MMAATFRARHDPLLVRALLRVPLMRSVVRAAICPIDVVLLESAELRLFRVLRQFFR